MKGDERAESRSKALNWQLLSSAGMVAFLWGHIDALQLSLALDRLSCHIRRTLMRSQVE